MRVVQIINSFGYESGGAERLAQDLHVDLLAAGVDAHLVALEECETAGLTNANSLGFAGPYSPGAVLALRRYLGAMSPKPDIAHAHLFPASAYVSGLKKMGAIRCPIIFTEHNTSNRRRGKAAYKLIDAGVYRAFDKIYCISDATRTALIKAYPQLTHKTEIIENGATLKFKSFFQREPKENIRILSVGRLTKQKNYPMALKAISMLQTESVTYTVLGDGTERHDIEALRSTLGLSQKVELKGHQPKIIPFLKDADVFFIPSQWEGFGLAAVEGMNAGLPVVASDVSGLRDVVGTDGTCAFLAPPDEPGAMADALQSLIGDAQRRLSMGRAAFERSKLFDRRVMFEKYMMAYRAVTREMTSV